MPSSGSSAKVPKATSARGKNGKSNGAAVAPKLNGNGGPSHDQIARRAYELYEAEGRQPGRDEEYWLRAETELSEL